MFAQFRPYILHISLFAVISIIAVAMLLMFAVKDSAELKVHEIVDREYNWNEAVELCNGFGGDWRMPSIVELTGLMATGKIKETNNDYWSGTNYFGYAFGANTRSFILSFDRFKDIDFVVCVKSL